MAIVDVDLEQVHAAVAEGADVVDIVGVGGEPWEETAAFIGTVRDTYPDLVISVSTGRRELGREACAAGADLIQAGLVEVAAEFGAAVVCSQNLVARAIGAGVDPDRIIVEPERIIVEPARESGQPARASGQDVGPGLADLVASGWPVLVDPTADDDLAPAGALAATLARTAVCAWLGARVFRVREVREARRVLQMVSAIRGDIPPARAVRGLA
jgi:dihydropteroate synthase